MKVSIVSNGFEWIISINGQEVCRGETKTAAITNMLHGVKESASVLLTHSMNYDKHKGMEYDTFDGKLSFINQE
jgi:hypothetical protein